MSTVEQTPITAEMLLAMPENGMDRWLVEGELREKVFAFRARFQSIILANLSYLLQKWNIEEQQLGSVHGNNVGVILKYNPDTVVGIDVAFFSLETMQQQTSATILIEGAPILAIEILSPSDTSQNITEKISLYLKYGVKLVWIVEPSHKTITVYASEKPPIMFNITQTITAEPYLPNFAVPLAEIFAGC